MTQNQKPIQLTAQKSTATKISKYLNVIRKYSLYSILIVLKEYEDLEYYEECEIIKTALEQYYNNISPTVKEGWALPTHLNGYLSKDFQKKVIGDSRMYVSEKRAISEAKIIKTTIPNK